MNVDKDARTVWCGNLSEKVTEDVLYELFLQVGPVERVSIPKDRDGKQRMYGFITYKHLKSVSYAINLFNGTALFNRALSLSMRKNMESFTMEQQFQDRHIISDVLLLGHQMLLGNAPFNMNPLSNPYQIDPPLNDHDRRSRRMHPYQRELERDKHMDKHKDHRSDRNKSNLRPIEYNRRDNHRSHRRSYR